MKGRRQDVEEANITENAESVTMTLIPSGGVLDQNDDPHSLKVAETQLDNATSPPAKKASNQNNQQLPIDRGYAWVIAAAMFIIHLLRGCLMRSVGVISSELVDFYAVSKGSAAILVSLLMGMRVVASAFIAYASRPFSNRVLIEVGGFLSFFGFFIAVFCTDFQSSIWCIGIFTGLGIGIITCISLGIVNEYFEKRRTIGISMIYGGTSAGALVGPHLFRFLVDDYSLRGALLLFSGVLLETCLLGALVRPISSFQEPEQPIPIKDAKKKQTKDIDSKELAETTTQVNVPLRQRIISTLLSGLTSQVLCNIWFWVFAVTIAMHIQANPMSFLLIVTHGSDIGLTRVQTSLLLTIQGGTDLVSRFLMAWIADLPCVDRSVFSTALLALNGLLWIGTAFAHDFVSLLCFALLQPIVGGGNNSILSSVLGDIVDKEHITVAYAYTFFVQGILFNAVPRLCGYLRDVNGNWQSSFWLLGGVNLFACCLSIVQTRHIRKKKDQERKTAENA